MLSSGYSTKQFNIKDAFVRFRCTLRRISKRMEVTTIATSVAEIHGARIVSTFARVRACFRACVRVSFVCAPSSGDQYCIGYSFAFSMGANIASSRKRSTQPADYSTLNEAGDETNRPVPRHRP